VSSKDTLTVHIRIVLLSITVVSRETLLGMRNVESTISSSLESTKDTASSSGSTASYIQKSTEGALVLIDLIDVVGLLANLARNNFGIHLGVSLVDIIESNLLEETTSTEESGTVGSSVVLKSYGKSVTAKLGGGGRGEDAISVNEGVCDLADYVSVGETDDETVLGGLVLVLCLSA